MLTSKTQTDRYTSKTYKGFKQQTDPLNKSWWKTQNGQLTAQLGLAGAMGIGQGIAASFTNKALEFQAQDMGYQSEMAKLNARLASLDIEGAYRTGEYQALMQGLKDRQEIATEVTRQAGSGTKIGQGSNADISTTQWINAQLNQITIRKNTIQSANRARLEQANAQAQAIIAQVNADAQRALKQNVFVSGVLGFTSALGQSMLMYNSASLKSPFEKAFFG